MTEITKQLVFDDFVQKYLHGENIHYFVSAVHRARMEEDRLPHIRNRYEGYGYIAESMNLLAKSLKGVKGAAGDCEAMLSGNDVGFVDMVSGLFDEALGLARDVINLAVHAQNIAREITFNQPPTPLEEMADSADVEDLAVADRLDNGEGAENNEDEEGLSDGK